MLGQKVLLCLTVAVGETTVLMALGNGFYSGFAIAVGLTALCCRDTVEFVLNQAKVFTEA